MATFDKSVFLEQFRAEAKEHLHNLSQGLLRLEKEPQNREVIDDVFREAHTLKGSATMMGFSNIRDISHAMEDILDGARGKQFVLSSEIIDKLLKSVDIIEELIVSDDKSASVNVQEVAKNLKELHPEDTPKVAKTLDVTPKVKEEKTTAMKEKVETDETIRIKTQKLDTLLNLTGELLISKNYLEQKTRWLKKMKNRLNKITDNILKISEDGMLDKEELLPLREEIQTLGTLSENIKDDFSVLQEDMEIATSRIGARTYQLQDEVMKVRMLPLSTLFAVFPRLVRDLAREVGKDISLSVSGEDTELDKQVIEEISESLMQLVRNAIDHGIEEPGIREELGKPKTARIKLAARSRGSEVEISISDDGRGISPEKVRNKAQELGIISPAEAAERQDKEIINLIFSSGFSTKDKATTLSGRGVGLDVVKEKVEKLKGQIEMVSEVNKGTKIILRLPLTLSITDAILVKAAGKIYAMPLSSILEIVRETEGVSQTVGKESMDKVTLARVETREVVVVRKKLIPLVRLRDILCLSEEEYKSGTLPIIIVGGEAHQLAILVDEIVGKQEIVIKPVSDFISKVENIAGSTIMGSGEVVLILDIPAIMNNAKKITKTERRERVTKEKEIPFILVVEDSLTTRELERSILESAGYRVDTAVDGLEGWEKIKKQKYDMIITDVIMPRMNGFELTKVIRSSPEHHDLPVVIVTTKNTDEDRKRGIEVGADEYIIKTTFDQQKLLSCVERLVK